VLTHKDFVRELAPDGEIQQLLEEIWGEAHDEELQRELTEEEKTLPQPLAEQHFQDRFWRRRPDGLAVNWKDKAIFVLDFTRSDDFWNDFIIRTEKRKNDRCRSFVNTVTSCLKGRCASEGEGVCRVDQLNFTTGVRDSINESTFNKSLAKLLVPANKVKAIQERQSRRALATLEIVL